jgi:hypothetical protein
MKLYNIDININLEKEMFKPYCLSGYEGGCIFSSFLHVAFTFSNFKAIKKLILAGADPFIDYGHTNVIETCETIIIPKFLYTIQPLLKKKIKVEQEYFSPFLLINRQLEPLLKKKRYGILNRIILLDPCSSSILNRKLTKKEKIEQLYSNTGFTRSFLRPNKEEYLKLKREKKIDWF